MQGEGGHANGGRTDESPTFDLGRELARLNGTDGETRMKAVETIRETVDEHPEQCLPTVPVLRSILGDSSASVDADVAYCLETLAAESAADVAPSVPAIISFLETETEPDSETTDSLLTCLERIAEHRPSIVTDHLETLRETDLEMTSDQRWPLTDDLGEEDGQRPVTDAVSESPSH